MWNLAEIKQKKNYVLERLKANISDEEKEKLELSLITYLSLLDNSGTVRYTQFHNFMDYITKNKFSLIKDQKYSSMESAYIQKRLPFLTDDYLNFLIQLVVDIYNSKTELSSLGEKTYSKFTFSQEQLVEISKKFYEELNDEEITNLSKKVLNDSTGLNFSRNTRTFFKDYGGLTFYDYIFNKAYCNIHQADNYFDIQATNHEVMHGIDSYFNPKIESEYYYGFHEVPTYTIDYLFLDFLEKNGFEKEEIDKLRLEKEKYIYYLSLSVLNQIRLKIRGVSKKLKEEKVNVANELKQILTFDLIKNLLEIESGVIARGFYNQIIYNSKEGINNLKRFMKNGLPKDQILDFSVYGLPNETLLEIAKMSETLEVENNKTNGL